MKYYSIWDFLIFIVMTDEENHADNGFYKEEADDIKRHLFESMMRTICDLDDDDTDDKKVNIDFGIDLNVYDYGFINEILSSYNWSTSGDIITSAIIIDTLSGNFNKFVYQSICGNFLLVIKNRTIMYNRLLIPSERLKVMVSRRIDNKIIKNSLLTQKELRRIFIQIKFNPHELLYNH